LARTDTHTQSAATALALHSKLLRGQGVQLGPPGSQPSPHAQPPPHNPNNPMMGPHGQPFMSPRYPGGPRPSLRMPNQPPVGVPGTSKHGRPDADESPQRDGWHGPTELWWWNEASSQLHGARNARNEHGSWRSRSLAQSQRKLNSLFLVISWQLCGGGGPPGTPIMPSPGDSTNSSENIYTMMNPIGPGGNRPNFTMGPGPDGPMGGMGSMEPHHMNGSLGSGDMDGLPKNSPNNMAVMNNPPGTPRDDGEMAGNFLNPFQSESPPGMSLKRRIPIKATHPSVCKVGVQGRKQSQSHRKSQLSDSPCLPGFLTGPG
ncbi:unnamed protein product, partial [Coregonus sp. 'balchen']